MFRPLKKPPAGMRWELHDPKRRGWREMHLVDSKGHSHGHFLAYDRDGNLTDYWRHASARIIRNYKRTKRFKYLPELAGYRIKTN